MWTHRSKISFRESRSDEKGWYRGDETVPTRNRPLLKKNLNPFLPLRGSVGRSTPEHRGTVEGRVWKSKSRSPYRVLLSLPDPSPHDSVSKSFYRLRDTGRRGRRITQGIDPGLVSVPLSSSYL